MRSVNTECVAKNGQLYKRIADRWYYAWVRTFGQLQFFVRGKEETSEPQDGVAWSTITDGYMTEDLL